MLNDDSFKISVPDRIGILLLQNLFPLTTNFVKMYLNNVIPRVSKHYLLLIAALVWTFAGGMLLYRGFTINHPLPSHWKIEFFGCTIAGLLFFMLLFNRISAKHVLRIKNLPIEHPVIFSFFNLKSYLMMFLMISMGITLRKTEVVSPEYLSFMYVTMGIPLLMSSFRFYHTFFNS
jgi:hypothetical protein